jgi:hypothetical protein
MGWAKDHLNVGTHLQTISGCNTNGSVTGLIAGQWIAVAVHVCSQQESATQAHLKNCHQHGSKNSRFKVDSVNKKPGYNAGSRHHENRMDGSDRHEQSSPILRVIGLDCTWSVAKFQPANCSLRTFLPRKMMRFIMKVMDRNKSTGVARSSTTVDDGQIPTRKLQLTNISPTQDDAIHHKSDG